MPTIPLIQDSADLSTGTGRQSIQAGAGAFGAREAQTAAGVGQSLTRIAGIAAEKEDEFNEAEARELDNELSTRIRERLYNPESGYLSTQRGRNAIDTRHQVEAEIDQIAAEIGARARNGRAAAMYQDVARRRVGSALGDIATYAARETTSYQNEVSEAAINEAIDNAVAAYADPAVVAANRETVLRELSNLGQRNGWDERVLNQRIRQFQSDISTRVITHLAETDPQAALDMFETIRPSLTAQEAGELITTVRATQRQAVERLEGAAWQAFANGLPLSSMGEDAYREFSTNPLYGQSHARLREAYRTRAQSYANGQRAQNDSPAYWGLRVLSQTDPQRFMEALPQVLASEEGATISRGDTGRLLEMYVGIQQGADVSQQRTAFNAVLATAQTALAPYGFDTAEDTQQGIALRAALLREVEGFMSANGGQAPNGEETQALIGRAVVSMRHSDAPAGARVRGVPNRERVGRQADWLGNQRGVDVAPLGETVVPYGAIPADVRLQIGTRLHQRLGRQPTRGEVENAYSYFLMDRDLPDGGDQ